MPWTFLHPSKRLPKRLNSAWICSPPYSDSKPRPKPVCLMKGIVCFHKKWNFIVKLRCGNFILYSFTSWLMSDSEMGKKYKTYILKACFRKVKLCSLPCSDPVCLMKGIFSFTIIPYFMKFSSSPCQNKAVHTGNTTHLNDNFFSACNRQVEELQPDAFLFSRNARQLSYIWSLSRSGCLFSKMYMVW